MSDGKGVQQAGPQEPCMFVTVESREFGSRHDHETRKTSQLSPPLTHVIGLRAKHTAAHPSAIGQKRKIF